MIMIKLTKKEATNIKIMMKVIKKIRMKKNKEYYLRWNKVMYVTNIMD